LCSVIAVMTCNKRTALAAGAATLGLNKCSQPEPMALAELLVKAAAEEGDQDQFIKRFIALTKTAT